jgi:putative ABC transport system permease protein
VHKLRVVLTVLGITMGVSTLITVMTLIQGANRYVETKVANLGTNVFQMSRTPFTVTDFNQIMKAFKYRRIEYADVEMLAARCSRCEAVGASASTSVRARYRDEELRDVKIYGHTANMADIDTRTVELGRYYTEGEDNRSAPVCLIGATVREKLFLGLDPLGRVLKLATIDCTVIGVFEKIGSMFGQDQDNFAVLPMQTFLRLRGRRSSLIINIKAPPGLAFEAAQGEATQILRAIRHVGPREPDDFFVATKESYIALWRSISSAFFAVFVMVSAISAIVGGIVIMNVMLVSVTERRKEIGVRRAVGATQSDILRQFLTESVIQCIVGGTAGIALGFALAWAVRQATTFPIDVGAPVAAFGLVMSSAIGIFFGIYPAIRASQLDPVVALRAD